MIQDTRIAMIAESHTVAITDPMACAPHCHQRSKRALIIEFVQEHAAFLLCYLLTVIIERLPDAIYPFVESAKVTMFAVGNAAELYPGSTLRGCEPLAVRHSLGVFHRSGCAL
jgi:hypothetical protein